MILNNISRAIREQNYYAVALEFIIVIAGIVVGFQINAWAVDQRLRVEEQAFADRLYADIETLQLERAVIAGRNESNRALNASVLEKLSEASSETEFEPEECAFIIVSNLINYDPADLPTLEELTSSGDRQFLRDPELNAAISTYFQDRQARREVARELSSKTVDLSLNYSGLILQRISVPEDGLTAQDIRASRLSELRQMNCDLLGMRANDEFLNNLVNNTVMTSLYVNAVSERTDESLSALTGALEAYRSSN